MKVLAFDVGGTTIKGGLVDEKLKIKEERETQAKQELDESDDDDEDDKFSKAS